MILPYQTSYILINEGETLYQTGKYLMARSVLFFILGNVILGQRKHFITE